MPKYKKKNSRAYSKNISRFYMLHYSLNTDIAGNGWRGVFAINRCSLWYNGSGKFDELRKQKRREPMIDIQHPYITRMEWFGTLHDEETIYKCDNCACEIYEGESFYDIGGDIYCVDCIKECCHTA